MSLFFVLLAIATIYSFTPGVRFELFDDEKCENSDLAPAFYYGQCNKRYQGNYERLVFDSATNKIVHHKNCPTDKCENCVQEEFENGKCYKYGSMGYAKFSVDTPQKKEFEFYSDNYLSNPKKCNDTSALFVRFVVPSECQNGFPGKSHRLVCENGVTLKNRVYSAPDCQGDYEIYYAGNDCIAFPEASIYMKKSCQEF